jgi:hypothetical protein
MHELLDLNFKVVPNGLRCSQALVEDVYAYEHQHLALNSALYTRSAPTIWLFLRLPLGPVPAPAT